jgi:hypothetical protein
MAPRRRRIYVAVGFGEIHSARLEPLVHPLAAIQPVRADDLMQPEKRRRVGRVTLPGHVEVPGAAEIVLGPGAADRGELLVAVEVELHLALTPPAGVVSAPGEIGADVFSGAVHSIKDRVQRAGGERVTAVELAVQVTAICDVHIDFVAHLVVDGGGLRRTVLQGEPGMPGHRHRPVAVEAAVRIGRDRQGGQLGKLTPALGEEVAEWYFDCGLVGAVPVGAQDEAAPVHAVCGQPEVCDERRAVDGGQLERGVPTDVDAGRDLPPRAEVCRRGRAGAFNSAGAAAFGAVEVFRADQPGLRTAQPGQRTKVDHNRRSSSSPPATTS